MTKKKTFYQAHYKDLDISQIDLCSLNPTLSQSLLNSTHTVQWIYCHKSPFSSKSIFIFLFFFFFLIIRHVSTYCQLGNSDSRRKYGN